MSSVVNTILRWVKRCAAGPTRFVLRQSGLKTFVKRCLMHFPALYGFLLDYVHRNGITTGYPIYPFVQSPDRYAASTEIIQLGPQARRIYFDLQIAARRRRGHR